MKVQVTMKKLVDGAWQAQALDLEAGNLLVTGRSREVALHNLREEITCRMDWRPRSGVEADYVKLDVHELPLELYGIR
jgi:hypothetical protein